MELPVFSDLDMATGVSAAAALGHDILVVANAYTALLATRDASPAGPWNPIGRGDFGLRAGAAAEKLAEAGRLWWQEVADTPRTFDVAGASPKLIGKRDVQKWLKAADTLTTKVGRGASPSGDDIDYLGYQAAWRCQFLGCGKDLRRQTATGVASKSSYFAHIIASSPKGPRGDALLSDVRSADIENSLLLCDECHRRIDREDPDRFTVGVLQRMREQSIAEVRRVLSSLQYREATPLVIMGNITGQPPQFVAREAEEALWTRQLRMAPGHPHAFFENGWSQHNPHSTPYWTSLFSSVEAELPQLRKLLRTSPDSGGGKSLAVFPLHGTSVLILAGRLFGEASAATLFQFRRERPAMAAGGRWAFDDVPAEPGKFFTRTLRPQAAGETEAFLVVSLTFSITPDRLGEHVFEAGVFKIPGMEVSAAGKLHHDILSNESELDAVSQQLGEAVRVLQDDWRVSRVHLFVGAPASVCFKLGQKLQARNQASYRCYESGAVFGSAFQPTIEINGQEVRVVGASDSLRI